MAVAVESPFRRSIVQQPTNMAVTLEDKYEVVKEIGDGSFGSVVLGRTRSAGAVTVRRNTMVCSDLESSPITATDLNSRSPSRQ